MASPVTHWVDDEAIGWIAIDAEGRVNAVSAAVLAGLRAALDAMALASIRAVVLTSGREGVFSAGADLRWLESLQGSSACSEASRKGQRIMEAIEALPVPVVAAIDGPCLGGGLELALACQWRIASDAEATRLGFPETGLGTIPGWGGSVRLPRLIGTAAAADLIVSARAIDADEALALGLVDEVVPRCDLRRRAASAAVGLGRSGRHVRLPVAGARPGLFEEARRAALDNPAAIAALDVLERTVAMQPRVAQEIETEVFGRLTASERCKDSVHGFLIARLCRSQGLGAWPGDPVAPALAVRRVGIVGRGEPAEALAARLGIAGCERVRLEGPEADALRSCDWVIESDGADPAARQALAGALAAGVPAASLGPLGDLRGLSDALGDPRLAMSVEVVAYAPRSSLVEVAVHPEADRSRVAGIVEVLRAAGLVPVVCRPGPTGIVTRVLFSGLNAALALWESGVPGVAIDRALADFGWGPGPLRLLDDIGLDRADLILCRLDRGLGRRFTASGVCRRLAERGLLGRKSGAGFYAYQGQDGAPNRSALRFVTGVTAGAVDSVGPVLSAMAREARACVAEGLVSSEAMVDFMMTEGAGFPRFRGGLLHAAGRGSP